MPSPRRPIRFLLCAALAAAPLAACTKDKGTPATATKPGAIKDLDSKDILARTETSPEVAVKHVLIGWKELAPAYRGHMDPRAAERSNADAAKIAEEVAAKLRADPASIDAVMKEYSEDTSSIGGPPYVVNAAARLVPEFKKLALRLQVNEVGTVKTDYGYHIMVRVPPPAPDPLESADVLARPPEPGTVSVQEILIGWKDVPSAQHQHVDPRAATRTKDDADKLVQEVLAKVRAGEDMKALMKQYSEDHGSMDTGRVYDIDAGSRQPEPIKNLSLRLQVGEAGVVKSVYGWHVIKRIPPPPPDSLESVDIMARQPVTEAAKVKHILLGWDEVNAGDPRGKARSRAELEALVKKTVAELEKGKKDPAVMDRLMAELSEDPGSAKNGKTYECTPTAQLAAPFKALGLRLDVGEIGVVKTPFGIHIMQRVE
jgi:parvulin-like peptidyl-prolyl isomerase